MLLDPTLPEKQRARRRLVGAIALVVAAIVILPMLLDSHPKPVTDDIAIDIPNRPVAKVTTPPQDTQAGVAPDSPSAGAGLAASGLAAATAGTAAQSAATASQAGTQSATKSPSKPAASQQTQSTAMNPAPPATSPSKPAKPSAAPTQSTESTARTAAAANADSGTPAAPAGARFALQLGVFPDDASAKAWATKLKAAGVPAYTERRKQTDGTTQTLLRAGPFPDRAAASAAIAKVRSAGLSSSANSGAAQ